MDSLEDNPKAEQGSCSAFSFDSQLNVFNRILPFPSCLRYVMASRHSLSFNVISREFNIVMHQY